NNISLKSFYIRRALRIFPVAYLFILVLIVLNIVFKLNVSVINFLGAGLYLMNFSSFFRKYYSADQTGHFWSLSVEEQFYLIVPFILKKNFKVYLLVILSIIFVLPLFICLQYACPALNKGILYAFTHYLIKFQAIAVGCLFSVLTFKYPIGKNIIKTKVIFNILAISTILYIQYDNFFSVKSVFSSLLISLLVGYIIITNIIPGNDFIFKILNAGFLKTIGILSYSIYIWQQLFTYYNKNLPAFMVTFPLNVVCLIIVSCCSYYLYEKPFLKLKARFSKVKVKQALVTAT
ncbi:MAG TPA: acyltransferase, partial [Mucilaginibacter sp.]